MEDQRRLAAEKEAAPRRATDAQVIEDAERLVAAWNERRAKRMPLLFSPTIGAAINARQWFLWVYCPACHTTQAIDLRTLDRHHDTAVTSLIPALSCRSCRPNAPFAQLVRLSATSVADELRLENARRAFGDEWTDKTTGQPLKSCTMIITEPNTFVAEVHDRMPVLLDPAQCEPWLDGVADKDILKPAG
jgi:hypothetical protein